MSKKKNLQQKKHLCRDTQEIARHVIDSPKRRRTRFICQVHKVARVTKYKPGIVMVALQCLYSVDKMQERIFGIGSNSCKQLLDSMGSKEVRKHE